MSTVLVTGAAGFIGGAVAEDFVARNWRVYGTVHRRPPMRSPSGMAWLSTDIRDANRLEQAVAAAKAGDGRLDAIVHCAARATDIGPRRIFDAVNTEPVRHLVSLAHRHNVGRLVLLSTTDVYGLRDHHGGDETLPLAPFPRNPYPVSKAAAETIVRAGLPPERFSIIRPAQVWGADDPTLTARVAAFLRASPAIVHFGPWRGANRWPLAHVRNVAKACFLAATRSEAAGQALNVLDSERTSIDEYYRIVARIFMPDKRFRTVCLPLGVGLAVGAAISSVSTWLGRDRPVSDPSHYAVYAVSRNLDFSNRRMLDLFHIAGERLVTRDEGIAELDRRKHRDCGSAGQQS